MPSPLDRMGGRSRKPGWGAWAARDAEIPTNTTNAHHSRQRLGQPRPQCLLARLEGIGREPSPNGEPQRAHTIRPARLRSALTAQLPQLGQAMAPHPRRAHPC